MRRTSHGFLLILLVGCGGMLSFPAIAASAGPLQPVPFTSVKISEGFWAARLETNRRVTIPYALRLSAETGRIKNFEIAGGSAQGAFCSKYPFDDSDVYKIIEGAAYSLSTHPDPALDKQLDELIAKIAAAQEKDGYLYTARTIGGPPPVKWMGEKRWSNLESSHELYNLGHLYEAAVAHFQATGKKTLWDVALRSADLILREFGPGRRMNVPGHQEIEIGLIKLYRLTGENKYLELARFFLDQRGNATGHKLYGEYSQDHLPVIEQKEAVGHAVRAVYMYAAMTDLASLTGDFSYRRAIDLLWSDVAGRKLYLTGGIGATGKWEGFGPPYVLPNASAYAETCAAIANALWNHRMFLLYQDVKYLDLLERILYNGFLSGVALSGDKFFYPNPLASSGKHERSPWFACACCPSNIPRFLPQLPGFLYSRSGTDVFVQLYAPGRARIELVSGTFEIEQSTDYPWNGRILLRFAAAPDSDATVRLRIPGWARGEPLATPLYSYLPTTSEAPSLKLNGQEIPLDLQGGFAVITRRWRAGDSLELNLAMPVRRVVALDAVEDNRGRIAVERGPIVYCAEWPDNEGRISDRVLEDRVRLEPQRHSDLLQGVTLLSGMALRIRREGDRQIAENAKITLIPYYAWAHRGTGEMAVWIPRSNPIPEKPK